MSVALSLLRLAGVLTVCRVIGVPLARRALPTLPATAYALAGSTTLVSATLVTWLLGHAGLRLGLVSIVLGLGLVAGSAIGCWRRFGDDELRPRRPDVAVHHLCYALAFVFALLVTMRNPSVDPDSERFMDLAMVNAVLESRQLPLEDPWLAGERVAYYDYGYFATAWLSLLVGPIDTFFPIAVALLWAALVSGVVALGRDLAGASGGLLAGLLVAVAGNLEGARQTLVSIVAATSGDAIWPSLDWFSGARVIEGCITEFPFFALLWGDLHPYVLALPLWPIVLALAVTIDSSAGGRLTIALGAVTFATLTATHTWDAVPAAAVLVLAAIRPGVERGRRVRAVVTIVGLGCLLAVPYLVAAPVSGRGLGWVETRSELTELVVAWGAQAVLLALAAIVSLRSSARGGRAPMVILIGCAMIVVWPQPGIALALLASLAALALWARADEPGERVAWAMAAVGAGLVFGVDLLYLDDFYDGELARMNTVFKAYVVAWVLIGVSAAVLSARSLRELRGTPWRVVALAIVVPLLILVLVYPVRATRARSGDLTQPVGLDTRTALRALYPDDAAAIDDLRGLERGVILEAVGGPYSWHARFASFTGFPTVLGWGNHEAGWRNDWSIVQAREREVNTVYRSKDDDLRNALLDRYRVRYIVVGALEQVAFTPAELEWVSDHEPVIAHGATTVYQVGGAGLRSAEQP